MDFYFFFWADRQHCPMSEKQYHKSERQLRLVAYIFTKLAQNVCLINIHIFIYQHARCHCRLWNALWFYCVFGHFYTLLLTINIWFIWLINTHMIYQHARCEVMKCIMVFSRFCEFCTQLMTIHVWSVLSPPNIHGLCV